MRGAKVVFCRERNKYVKNTKFWWLISAYFILKLKNGIVLIAASPKKNEIVQITSYLSTMP